jgi:thiol-disulfide isomerase/thioredoxin
MSGLAPRRLKRRQMLASLICGMGAVCCPRVWAQQRLSPWRGPRFESWLQGTDLNGQAWSAQSLRGKPVVLNFWASWCPPCVQELPSLQALQEQMQGQVQVLTVNVKENPRKAQRYLQTHGLTLPTLSDAKGEWVKGLGITVYPTTLLIASDGQVRWRVEGEVDWESIEAQGWVEALASKI